MLTIRNTVLVFKWLVSPGDMNSSSSWGAAAVNSSSSLGAAAVNSSSSNMTIMESTERLVQVVERCCTWYTLPNCCVNQYRYWYLLWCFRDFWRFFLVLAYLLMTKKSLKISFKQCCGTGSVFRSFMDPYSEFRSGPIHVKIGYNRDKWCKI